MATPPTKVLVAVHGMGDQTRFETLQQLANLCFAYHDLPQGVPVGYLDTQLASRSTPWAVIRSLPGLGFAEVFWADIGRRHERYVLEDPVHWSETIVERLRVIDRRVALDPAPLGYSRIRRTLADLALAIRLTRLLNRNLTVLGVGSVAIDDLLVRFLGDVQLYADFGRVRRRIMARFRTLMHRIDSADNDAEIHICAHSEGAVVAFLGLLDGYHEQAPWVDRVKSVMTIGAPIDTFLVLWPELWEPFVTAAAGRPPIRRITWFNYADRGDPVGDALPFARDFTRRFAPGLFEPEAPRDRLFRRYAVPGKAHVDYWNDEDLFAEWLAAAVFRDRQPQPPTSRVLARCLGPVLPFAASAGLALVSAHFFGTGINQIAASLGDPGRPTISATTTSAGEVFGFSQVVAVALLILGSVAFGGASRTSLRWCWLFLGLAIFVAGAAATISTTEHSAVWVVGGLLLVAVGQNLLDRWTMR